MSFIILGWHRTGTTCIQTAINSHPNIICENNVIRNLIKSGDINFKNKHIKKNKR